MLASRRRASCTPQRLTDEAGKTVWRAEYRPFGEFETVDTDPDKDGVAVVNNLRFAGQYDEGLFNVLFAQGPFYNWNCWYEPATGHSFQPEPMLQDPTYAKAVARQGFSASAYGYANNNPLTFSDATGLMNPSGGINGAAVCPPTDRSRSGCIMTTTGYPTSTP